MAGQLTEAQINDYRENFSVFDKDGDGKITADELGVVMKQMGKSLSKDELLKMINEVDTDGNGTVNFDEFLIMMGAYKKNDAHKLHAAFAAVDKDGSGYITHSELKEAMANIGKYSDTEIDDMITAADTDNDGRVNYQEFVKLMSTK